jgi:hypothetical protein
MRELGWGWVSHCTACLYRLSLHPKATRGMPCWRPSRHQPRYHAVPCSNPRAAQAELRLVLINDLARANMPSTAAPKSSRPTLGLHCEKIVHACRVMRQHCMKVRRLTTAHHPPAYEHCCIMHMRPYGWYPLQQDTACTVGNNCWLHNHLNCHLTTQYSA